MVTKTIIEVIAHSNFMADALQVERLAGAVVDGHVADATYLRIILAHMQAQLGKPRRGRRAATDVQSSEAVLDSIHERLYAAVLKGVGPEELATAERNRRATFARSAASTVRYFIRNAGDVRSVDVATATKSGLRTAVQPKREAPAGETRVERAFRNAQDALVRNAQRLLARGDPEARAHIEAAMDALEALLDAVPEGTQADVGAQTTTFVPGRAGARSAPAQAPMLHRGG